jgi:hypothetical protein
MAEVTQICAHERGTGNRRGRSPARRSRIGGPALPAGACVAAVPVLFLSLIRHGTPCCLRAVCRLSPTARRHDRRDSARGRRDYRGSSPDNPAASARPSRRAALVVGRRGAVPAGVCSGGDADRCGKRWPGQRRGDGARVAPGGTRHHCERGAQVGDSPGHRAVDDEQLLADCHLAGGGDPPERGFQRRDAAALGRPAQRAEPVAAQPRGAIPAATATASPPLEAPGVRAASHGLTV